MSYPPTIHTLVIEDSQQSKEHYEAVFDSLKSRSRLVSPRWAFCYSDGLGALKEPRMYHLVIIDLRLPEHRGQPESEELEFGLSLLKECATRETYPVPAVLVISGHLAQARQQELDQRVRSSFAYGRVIAKSDHLEDEIARVLEPLARYQQVGIHLCDAGRKLYPTLSPREEDLLRRCILHDDTWEGIDLAWWTANYTPHSGWVKVLMGRFLLQEGRGHSLYSFFKFAPSDGAEIVERDARVLSQKLRHVKLLFSCASGTRSLLVTQAVGSGLQAPLALGDVLARPMTDVQRHLPTLAASVVEQAAALGERAPDKKPLCEVLWRHHDLERIARQWVSRGGEALLSQHPDITSCPVALYRQLRGDQSLLAHDVQAVLHGDLNYTNVAVEEDRRGMYAFIFDAAGSSAGISSRDIAMLEVTLLLHQETAEDLVLSCAGLYTSDWETADVPAEVSERQANTFIFIKELRMAIRTYVSDDVYALTVVDHALMQLGGLDFGSSCNKIANPQEACLLAGLASRWYESHRPPTHGGHSA